MENFKITFYNAGRQDAILIEADGYKGFVDGGSYSMGDKLIKWMKGLGVEKLDFYIGTHAHANHVGCAGTIIKYMKPSVIYIPHSKVKTAMLAKCKLASEKNSLNATPFKVLTYKSEQIVFGQLLIKCLGPEKIVSCDAGATKENYNSLILKLTYKDKKALLVGDTNNTILASVLAKDPSPKVDIYKNAHHNGMTSSANLKKMAPKYAVICHVSAPSILYQRALSSLKIDMVALCSTQRGTTSFTYQGEGKDFLVLNHGQKMVNGVPNLPRVLKFGTSGSDVLFLQKRLVEFGFNFITPGGNFSEKTANAVCMFRYLYDLEIDKKVSSKQWSQTRSNAVVDTPMWNMLWKTPEELKAKKKTGFVLDISVYDPVMKYERVKHIIEFLVIRGSIGLKKDTLYEKHAEGCRANGIAFGAYNYLKSRNAAEAVKEAKFFYEAVKDSNPLFYVADVEYSGLKNEKAREVLAAWTKTLRDLGVKKIGYYIANHRRKAMNIKEDEADFIWIPNYGKNTGSWDGALPYGTYDIHQYTSLLYIPAEGRRKDGNRMNPNSKIPMSFYKE